MGLFDNYELKNKIRKLKKAKEDLTDDASAIRAYNGHVDSIISDFISFVRSGNAAVVNKLADYKEPYQYNDNNLTNAGNYIQKEINYQSQSLPE